MTPAQWMGLDTAHLVDVGFGHRLQRETAEAFATMQETARADGIGLDITSSHRDFNRQQRIWDRKWRGEVPLFSRTGEQLDVEQLTDSEKLHAILIWSALPGASRHHWGTDLDVYDKTSCEARQHHLKLVPEEYQPGGPCHDLNLWLNENMAHFGFYRPYAKDTGGVAPEPWHLSYRPAAERIIGQLNINALADCLKAKNIEGADAVLTELPTLFQRYTLNKGSQAEVQTPDAHKGSV